MNNSPQIMLFDNPEITVFREVYRGHELKVKKNPATFDTDETQLTEDEYIGYWRVIGAAGTHRSYKNFATEEECREHCRKAADLGVDSGQAQVPIEIFGYDLDEIPEDEIEDRIIDLQQLAQGIAQMAEYLEKRLLAKQYAQAGNAERLLSVTEDMMEIEKELPDVFRWKR